MKIYDWTIYNKYYILQQQLERKIKCEKEERKRTHSSANPATKLYIIYAASLNKMLRNLL